MNRPLCPHCYRDACPWLTAYHGWLVHFRGPNPTADHCPLADTPLPPLVVKRLRNRLASSETP